MNMKAKLHLPVHISKAPLFKLFLIVFIHVGTLPCFAIQEIADLSRDKAEKEFGIKIRTQTYSENHAKVWIEFPVGGPLEGLSNVDLRIVVDNRQLVSAPLQIQENDEVMTAHFSTDPKYLGSSTVTFAVWKSKRTQVGYRLSVREFLEVPSKDNWSQDGVWKPIAAVLDGVRLPNAAVKAITLKIQGKQYEVTVEGEDQPDRGTVILDTNTNPKRMTIKSTKGPNQGKTFLAIYEMKNVNAMRVCYDLSGQEFPKNFKAPKGSGRYLVGYRRQKE